MIAEFDGCAFFASRINWYVLVDPASGILSWWDLSLGDLSLGDLSLGGDLNLGDLGPGVTLI